MKCQLYLILSFLCRFRGNLTRRQGGPVNHYRSLKARKAKAQSTSRLCTQWIYATPVAQYRTIHYSMPKKMHIQIKGCHILLSSIKRKRKAGSRTSKTQLQQDPQCLSGPMYTLSVCFLRKMVYIQWKGVISHYKCVLSFLFPHSPRVLHLAQETDVFRFLISYG